MKEKSLLYPLQQQESWDWPSSPSNVSMGIFLPLTFMSNTKTSRPTGFKKSMQNQASKTVFREKRTGMKHWNSQRRIRCAFFKWHLRTEEWHFCRTNTLKGRHKLKRMTLDTSRSSVAFETMTDFYTLAPSSASSCARNTTGIWMQKSRGNNILHLHLI